MYQWLLQLAILSASPSFRTFAEPTLLPQRPLLNHDALALETTQLYSLHRKLVEIPSISDSEHAVGDFLASYLTARDFKVEKQSIQPFHSQGDHTKHQQRFNLLAYPSASPSNSTRVLLTAQCVFLPFVFPSRHPISQPFSVQVFLHRVPSMLTPNPVSASIPSHPTSLTITTPQLTKSPVAALSTQRPASLHK